jgi:hypothetical protein
MSAASRLQGYRDGRQDAADDLPVTTAGRDADYSAGYLAGYTEMQDVTTRRVAADVITSMLQRQFPEMSTSTLRGIARRAADKSKK